MSNTAFKTSSTNQITNQPPAESDIILRSDASAESTEVTIYGKTKILAVAASAEITITGFATPSADFLGIGSADGEIYYSEDGVPGIGWAGAGSMIDANTGTATLTEETFATAIKEMINGESSSQTGWTFPKQNFDAGQPITATVLGAVITVTADDPGTQGNSIDFFGSPSWASFSSATFEGGIDEEDVPFTEAIDVEGELESISSSSFFAINQASAGTTPSGNITALSPGTAAEGDISALANPSDGAILTIGIEGNTQAYRFKNTTAASYDVNIGASASDTMLSLKRALNADGTPGVDYHAGTLINPLLSGTVATVVITVTDRLDCKRQLAWTFTEAAADFALRIPRGGEDGTILFSLSPTVEIAADNLTFSTEDHLTDTLPALRIAQSVTVAIGGDIAAYRIYNELAIKVVFQTSTDQINWLDTAEGELTLGADTTTFANFTLPTEFLRFKVTENLSVVDGALDARVIY